MVQRLGERLRSDLAAGLGLTAPMVALGISLVVAPQVYLNSLPPDGLPVDAGTAIYDTLVRFLQDQLRTIAVVGLVVAVGAILTGPSLAAVRMRAWLSSGIAWLRDHAESIGLRTGRVGTWTYDH